MHTSVFFFFPFLPLYAFSCFWFVWFFFLSFLLGLFFNTCIFKVTAAWNKDSSFSLFFLCRVQLFKVFLVLYILWFRKKKNSVGTWNHLTFIYSSVSVVFMLWFNCSNLKTIVLNYGCLFKGDVNSAENRCRNNRGVHSKRCIVHYTWFVQYWSNKMLTVDRVNCCSYSLDFFFSILH